MIPKVIHFCWFGKKEYPPIVEKCIQSWYENCPDYEIKLWNEDNYDVTKNEYIKEAYDSKKWAFVSDYARLDIIYNEGGIYLDTDVELVKSLDDLLLYKSFFAGDGQGINTGLGFGAEIHNENVKILLREYDNKYFIQDGKMDLTPCTIPNSKFFLNSGYDPVCTSVQNIKGSIVLPPEYFSPINAMSEINVTPNTLGIHYGSRLWQSGLTRFKAYIRLKIGVNKTNKIKMLLKLIGIKR